MTYWWRWGSPGESAPQDTPEFADRSAAEDWLRDTWPDLLESGVDEVTLMRGDQVVYGPMGLRPAD